MLRAVTALLSFLLLAGTAAAQSGRHMALVVGIGEYRELRGVVRPAGDARAVHERLSRLGFDAELVVDADAGQLDEAFGWFKDSVRAGDVAVVYFSGHAGRVAGEFTLLAADAPQGARPTDQPTSFGLGISALADDLKRAGVGAQILFVDACRGDPYAGAPPELGPTACGDLGQALPEGTFALFSAAAGQKALDRLGDDDQDPHSLFTRVLLARIGLGGSVVRLARAVRDEVSETALSVRYPQTPTALDELAGPPVTLVPEPDAAGTAQPASPPSGESVEAAPALPPPRERAPPPSTNGAFSCGAVAPGPPSFDCRRVRRFAEAAICGDPRLGSCDRVLNGTFEDAQSRAGRGTADLRRDQDAWLARRDACAEVAPQGAAAVADCIGLAYEERIAALTSPRELPGAGAAPSPSFDCRYANTPVEQAICGDAALAAKDRRMARLYERAGGSRFGPVDPTQRSWLTARDACSRAAGRALQACLHEAYDGRISELGG